MQPGAAGQSVRWWRTLRSGFGLGGTSARSWSTPGSQLLIGGGKDGNIYVVDTANMGHFSPPGQVTMNCPNPNAVQAIMGPQSEQGGQGVVGIFTVRTSCGRGRMRPCVCVGRRRFCAGTS